jgi:hypothetical protein
MRSREDRRDSGNAHGSEPTVQDTLDAFGPTDADDEGQTDAEEDGSSGEAATPAMTSIDSRQESIDSFTRPDNEPRAKARPSPGSRALEGLALEMAIERVALSEASSGISRDELLITIAREVEVPLERLDLVDGFLSDLELEGKVRRVGDSIVLVRPDDGDLVAMDLTDTEFLVRYRRRYLTPDGGDGR